MQKLPNPSIAVDLRNNPLSAEALSAQVTALEAREGGLQMMSQVERLSVVVSKMLRKDEEIPKPNCCVPIQIEFLIIPRFPLIGTKSFGK